MPSLRSSPRALLFAVLACLVLPLSAAAATITWSNAAGGSWNVPANWSPPQVPVAGDDVVIALAGTYTVTMNVSPSINSLTLGGASGIQTLSMQSVTLTLAAASSVGANGRISMINGTVTGPGLLTNSGTILATSACTIGAPLATTASSVLRAQGDAASGAGTLTVASGFTNNGTIELTNTSLNQAATLNVTAGTLVNPVGGTIVALAGSGGGPRTLGLELNNAGTVTIAQTVTLARTSAQHVNSGTITLTTGDLSVSGSGTAPTFTNTGTITVPASRTLTVANATFHLNSGAVSGSGTWALSSSTLNLNIPHTTGPLALAPVSSTINGPALLTNGAGVITVINNVSVNAPLVNNGTWVVRAACTQAGALTTGSGSTLRVEGNGSVGSSTLTVASGFTNNGGIELTNTSLNQGATLNVTAGTLVNPVGGTIAALAGSGGGPRTLGLELNNAGTVTIEQTTTLGRSAAQGVNSGTITLTTGDLSVSGSGTAPTFTNTGTITVPASRTLTVANATFHLNGGAVSGSGTWALSSSTLNLNIPHTAGPLALAPVSSTINGPALLTNGAGVITVINNVSVNAPLVNNGTWVVRAACTQAGALTTGSGSTLRVEGNGSVGSSTLTVASGFTNNGGIELTNTSLNQGAALNVTAGTLVNPVGGTIAALAGSGGGARTLGLELNNAGTVTIAQTTTLGRSAAQGVNSGTIALTTGDLSVSGSGTAPTFTNTGTITVPASRTLTVANATFHLNSGAVSGSGTWALSSSTLNLNIPHTTGPLALAPVSSTINGPALLTNGAGVITVINNVSVNAPLANNGTWVVRSACTQAGALTTGSGSTLRVEGNGSVGSSTLTVASGFTNNGGIELTNTSLNQGAALNVTAGTLVNPVGGTIAALAGSGGGPRTLGLELNNAGTVTIAQTATLARASAQHANSGTLSVIGGDLTVQQSGTTPSFTNTGGVEIAASRTLFLTSNGAFTNAAAGRLSGAGTLSVAASVAFTNAGTIAPGSSPGVLHITGACPLTPTSQLQFELGGTTAGTGFDQLAVTGALTVDGSIAVSLVNGFTPALGQSFPVVTAGSMSPGFFTMAGLDVGGGLQLQPQYSATGLSLVVVSTTWVRLLPASASPPARDAHVAVSDEAHARMVVFGGEGNAGVRNDVWVLDHADGQGGDPAWTALAPTGTPPAARRNAAGAYDAAGNRLIVFGGDDGAGTPAAFGDVWVLANANGTGGTPAWTTVSAPGGPGARSGAGVAFDAATHRLIVFGGSATPATCGSEQNDVWVLNGADGTGAPSWTLLAPSGTAPTGRLAARAAYDATNNVLLLTGGFTACGATSGEQWLLSSANGTGSPAWTLLAPTGTAPALRSQSATWNASLNRTFVFGGDSAGVVKNTLTSLSNANGVGGAGDWFDPKPASTRPDARTRHGAVSMGARMVVFGGQGASARLADVWVLEETQGRIVDAPPVEPGPLATNGRTDFARPPFPNPAVGAARFALAVSREQRVELTVCDVSGRHVATLQDGVLPAGEHTFAWKGRADSGARSAPGVYFVRLHAGDRVATRSFVLAR